RNRNRISHIATDTQVRIQWNRSDNLDLFTCHSSKTISNLLTAAGAENIHGGAIRKHHGRHVFNHARNLLVGLHRDRPCSLGNLSCGSLRSGHNEQLSIRDQLGNSDGDVTSSWRKIQQQNIQVAPEHVSEELLDGTVQHWSTPHHRSISFGEV